MGSTVNRGRLAELYVQRELLRAALEVYVPIADDVGIDIVARVPGGNFVEIQVKSTSPSAQHPRWFQVITAEQDPVRPDLCYVFVEPDETSWILPASILFDLQYTTRSKNKKGKYVWDLNLPSKPKGATKTRAELLASYRNNWHVIARRSKERSTRKKD